MPPDVIAAYAAAATAALGTVALAIGSAWKGATVLLRALRRRRKKRATLPPEPSRPSIAAPERPSLAEMREELRTAVVEAGEDPAGVDDLSLEDVARWHATIGRLPK